MAGCSRSGCGFTYSRSRHRHGIHTDPIDQTSQCLIGLGQSVSFTFTVGPCLRLLLAVGTNGAENCLTLSQRPDPVVTPWPDMKVGYNYSFGLAKDWCTTESSAETLHLAVDHVILALGPMWLARRPPACRGMASSTVHRSHPAW